MNIHHDWYAIVPYKMFKERGNIEKIVYLPSILLCNFFFEILAKEMVNNVCCYAIDVYWSSKVKFMSWQYNFFLSDYIWLDFFTPNIFFSSLCMNSCLVTFINNMLDSIMFLDTVDFILFTSYKVFDDFFFLNFIFCSY